MPDLYVKLSAVSLGGDLEDLGGVVHSHSKVFGAPVDVSQDLN